MFTTKNARLMTIGCGTLDYIVQKYSLDIDVRRMPIEIPNAGREDLARLFAELGFTVGAEIGVQQARYSAVLCRLIPDLQLYGIDPWQTYEDYQDYGSQTKMDEFREIAKRRLAAYNCELIEKSSMEALADFSDASLDFVYIDGNHDFLHVTQDVVGWLKKIRHGGIISGHDYLKSAHSKVGYVIDAYTRAQAIRPWFVLGQDDRLSWMWVIK